MAYVFLPASVINLLFDRTGAIIFVMFSQNAMPVIDINTGIRLNLHSVNISFAITYLPTSLLSRARNNLIAAIITKSRSLSIFILSSI